MREQSSDPQTRGARKSDLRSVATAQNLPRTEWQSAGHAQVRARLSPNPGFRGAEQDLLIRLILFLGATPCELGGRTLKPPRGPKPDHLWSQSAPNKQEVGRASTFLARGQSGRAAVGTPGNRGLGLPALTDSYPTPSLRGPPRTLSRPKAFPGHKRGNGGTRAQRGAETAAWDSAPQKILPRVPPRLLLACCD